MNFSEVEPDGLAVWKDIFLMVIKQNLNEFKETKNLKTRDIFNYMLMRQIERFYGKMNCIDR